MVCFIFEKRLVLINVNSTLFHEIDFLEKLFKTKYKAQNRIGFQFIITFLKHIELLKNDDS